MARGWLMALSVSCVGCTAPPEPRLPDPDALLEPSGAPAPDDRKFCADFRHREFAPRCVREVEAQVLDQVGGYELLFSQGRLQQACLRGLFTTPSHPTDLACVEYEYAGRLQRSRGVAAGGRILWETRLVGDGTRVEFWDGHGRRRASEEEVFGEQLEFDAEGRLTSETFLDASGAPTPDGLGRVRLKYAYSKRDVPDEMIVVDAHGTPTTDDRGVCIEGYDRFDSGAKREERFFSTAGEPVDADGVYQRQVWKRDELGRLVEERRFRANGDPARFEKGHSIRRSIYRERRREDLYLDAAGAPFPAVFGGSRLLGHHDEEYRPRRLEVFHLGSLVGGRGFAIIDIQYGLNRVDRRFYDRDKKLVRGRAAHFQHAFSAPGFETSLATFDAHGNPTPWKGAARSEYAYADGKLSEERAYGVDGKLLEQGIAVRKYTYDALGRISHRQGFDRDGNELQVMAMRRISFRIPHGRNDELEAAKQAAMTRARAVWRRITSERMSFTRAYRTYDELRVDQKEPEVHVTRREPDQLLQELGVGDVSEPVYWDGGVHIYQRMP